MIVKILRVTALNLTSFTQRINQFLVESLWNRRQRYQQIVESYPTLPSPAENHR